MADEALKRIGAMRNPATWLIAGLEGAQASTGPGRYDPGWFHPSDLPNECDAFLAFKFLGAPAVVVISAQSRRIFDLGSARDDQLKKDMKKSGLSVITKNEQRKVVIPHLRIRGELDDLVKHPITGELYIIDYKTMRPEYFEKITEAEKGHIIQVHPYEFAKETYKGFILYENKGNQDLKAYPANFDNSLWQERIVNRLERVLEGLDKDIVYRNPVTCNRCPFFANGVCTSNRIRELREKSGLYAAA